MSIRTKLFDKGRLIEEQMIRFLIKIDERITALEEGGSSTPYDDTEIKADISALETAIGDANSGLTKAVNDNATNISALETAIGDESTGGTILARIKALEDA